LVGTPTPDILLNAIDKLPRNISDTANSRLSLTLSPIDLGLYKGLLHVVYQIFGDSIIHDTLIAYELLVIHGSRVLSVDQDSIYLGTFRLCQSRDSGLIISNLGCDVLDSISITIGGEGNFSITPPSIASALTTGKNSKVNFHLDPTQSGFIVGKLIVSSVSDTLPIHVITITANIIPTDTLTFSIAPTRTNFHTGDTVSVLMIPQHNVHGRGLYTLSFLLNYNGDLLTLLSGTAGVEMLAPNIISSPPLYGGTSKHTTAQITLVGNPSLEFDSLVPAMKFHFSTTLTDSITTTFILSDVKLNGGDSIYSRCELGVLSASLDYTLLLRCGDSTLVKFLQLGDNLKIFADAVYPNPITEASGYLGKLPFRISTSGSYRLFLFDGLGREVLKEQLDASSPGSYYLMIDGKALAGGCYSYILQEVSNSSSAVRGRFLIAKYWHRQRRVKFKVIKKGKRSSLPCHGKSAILYGWTAVSEGTVFITKKSSIQLGEFL
ncbi:MAG: hypothetical protein ABI778_01465, partial [Ignavibacteriota bacterium]